MATAAVLAAVLTLAAPAPALAVVSGWRGSGLTGLQVLGIYVGGPLGLFLLIALLFVALPAWASGSRHRPELVWTAEPTWFGGPADGQGALQVTEPSEDGGGASASW